MLCVSKLWQPCSTVAVSVSILLLSHCSQLEAACAASRARSTFMHDVHRNKSEMKHNVPALRRICVHPTYKSRKTCWDIMDFHHLVKNSVANIQDELTKILTLASFWGNPNTESENAFQKQVLLEYNAKIHKMRAENGRLREKNNVLSERVRKLEVQLRTLQEHSDHQSTKARPFRSEGAIKLERESGPRDSMNDFNSGYEISSSPLKPTKKGTERMSPVKYTGILSGAGDKTDITSSQFNRLATQYSDASSQPDSGTNMLEDVHRLVAARQNSIAAGHHENHSSRRRSSSPLKNVAAKRVKLPHPVIQSAFASEDESDGDRNQEAAPFVGDSQDEFEPFGNPRGPISTFSILDDKRQTMAPSKPKYPPHYTALQRVEFLRNYYRPKITEKNFKLDFSKNPITEKKWSLEDFVPNQKWKPPKKLNEKLGVMTKAQELVYDEFFAKAGLGKKAVGPAWDSDVELEHEDKGETWVRSQVMDKYLSPPGYMIGDFVSTQDGQEMKRSKNVKEQERIKRRFESAISEGEFVFYEPVFNDFAKAKKYVNRP